jgi:hypothetical protein
MDLSQVFSNALGGFLHIASDHAGSNERNHGRSLLGLRTLRKREGGEPMLAPFALRYLASGCGRSWKWIALLVVPLPPSMWKGVRVLMEAQRPRPFQPASGSSMRPSSHLV